MLPDGSISSLALEEALAIAGLGCWVIAGGEAANEVFPSRISANFHALLGQASPALPNSKQGWLALAHPDDRTALQALFSQLEHTNGTPAQGEFTLRLKHASGAWAWFDVRMRRSQDLLDDLQIVTFNDVTLQKQTEAALRDSQLRYRALYSTAPLAFILWNRQGQITEWNRRAESMFGWQSHEVIGKPVHRLLLPVEQHDAFRSAIKSLTQGDNHTNYTGPALGKDGLLLHCTWYNVALRNTQGSLLGILSLVLDITQEKLAEQQLQKNEKNYRTLVQTSPDAILLLGLDGKLNMANQQAQHIFGLDELDDVSTINLRDLLPAEKPDESIYAIFENPEEFSGFILNQEMPMQRLDGRRFDASSAFTTITDSFGNPSGIVFFARDITEKLLAERELEKHRQHLEELVLQRTEELELARSSLAEIIDGSPVPTFVLDHQHTVTHWNKACESVIGIPAEKMVGTQNQWHAFYDHQRPVLADLVMTGDKALADQLYQNKIQHSQLLPDGLEAEDYFSSFQRWVFATAAPLRDRQGNIIGAIETLQDTSQRKKDEIALREAKQIAEAAANTKAEFLANMSHEIRTPMNAVIGLAHLLYKTELTRKQQDYVSRIQGAGEILLRLINDVLDFSKIEAGRMQLESVPFVLDNILANVATIVAQRAQEKGLELHYLVEPDVPSQLIGDPLRLTQILVNLLGNAIKFTASGTVTAWFRKVHSEQGRIVLEVDVQDTGIGMTPEQQASLFHAFSQADSSITRNYGGTGLGLSICKRLVELMNGTIWVTSQPNLGSTFSFQVMLELPEKCEELATTEGKNYRALVVDDNPLARTVLMRLLEKLGCATQVCDSGKAALEILQRPDSRPFDYVTIDLNMPDMDGLTLASHICELLRTPPKLVLVTASDTQTMEAAGKLQQFHAILNKPITAVQIGAMLSDTPNTSRSSPQKTPLSLQGLSILLAEDIPTNQLIATEMLQSYGATVAVADNGRQAVDAIIAHGERFDLILMDLQMPEMDGLEATRRIRSQFPERKIPIIAMTAHALDEERERCLAAGMNDFITKPVDPINLETTLLRWKPASRPNPASAPDKQKIMSTTNESDAFPHLPGIDSVEGLRRMMNKRALYERVLRDFQKRFAGEAALIRAALTANDPETAERHAHSTKGLSGSIGAQELHLASRQLEESIRDKASDIPVRLEHYEQSLKTVIDGINQAFPTH